MSRRRSRDLRELLQGVGDRGAVDPGAMDVPGFDGETTPGWCMNIDIWLEPTLKNGGSTVLLSKMVVLLCSAINNGDYVYYQNGGLLCFTIKKGGFTVKHKPNIAAESIYRCL